MSKYDKPFQFPPQLLEQLAECSKDSCFFFVYKDDQGNLVPMLHALSQTDALALSSFIQKYLAAMDNIEIQQLIEMFHASIHDYMEEQGEDIDEEE